MIRIAAEWSRKVLEAGYRIDTYYPGFTWVRVSGGNLSEPIWVWCIDESTALIRAAVETFKKAREARGEQRDEL